MTTQRVIELEEDKLAAIDELVELKQDLYQRRIAELILSPDGRNNMIWTIIGSDPSGSFSELFRIPAALRTPEERDQIALIITAAIQQAYHEILFLDVADIAENYGPRIDAARSKVSRAELKAVARGAITEKGILNGRQRRLSQKIASE